MKRSRMAIYIAAIAGVCAPSVLLLGGTVSTWGEEEQVVEAVHFALTLEHRAETEAPFETRADLERFFRQGFGARLAADMAQFNWPHGADELLPPPSSINVLRLSGVEAVTYYETPRHDLNPDNSNRYAVQKVLKEDGRWVICDISFSTEKPLVQ